MAPTRRMSGIVFDAENRDRVAKGTFACSALASPVNNELEWKKGSGAYTALPGPSSATVLTCTPVRAKRPCVHRTAFGNPVDPDVKMSRYRSSGSAGTCSMVGSTAASCAA